MLGPRRKRSLHVFEVPASGVTVKTFAVNAHRRCNDDPAHAAASEFFKEDGSAAVVGADVAIYGVHALADANLGCQMKNHSFDAVQRLADERGIADVANYQADAAGQHHRITSAMDLFDDPSSATTS